MLGIYRLLRMRAAKCQLPELRSERQIAKLMTCLSHTFLFAGSKAKLQYRTKILVYKPSKEPFQSHFQPQIVINGRQHSHFELQMRLHHLLYQKFFSNIYKMQRSRRFNSHEILRRFAPKSRFLPASADTARAKTQFEWHRPLSQKYDFMRFLWRGK
uniref:Uncharacterized protein n=1 Tax=Spironucleus salmonicida TaxID=348837 RepID=V6LE11_9EUKA|eukprot:EST42735.1 Hypothetical protein SS50377_17656 [Spironucleus salmonicida]